MAIAAKTKEQKDLAIKNLKYMRDKDNQMVRGIFKNYECPGGSLSFNFRKYKEDQIEPYSFVDGGIYTVPLKVAKHLNNNCFHEVHGHALDADGKPVQRIKEKVYRYGFSSLEFSDIDDLDSERSNLVHLAPLS